MKSTNNTNMLTSKYLDYFPSLFSNSIQSLVKLTAMTSLSALAFGLSACQSHSSFGNMQGTIVPKALPQAQLLNYSHNPSPSAMAKARFVNAIKLHMASEHLSTSIVQYRMKPFISEESIDADSQSLFQTAIETYLYGEDKASESNDLEEEAMIEQYIEEIEAEIADAKANDDDSYDDYTEEDIREEAEYRYLVYTYEQEYAETESSGNPMDDFFKNYVRMTKERVEQQRNGIASAEETDVLADLYSDRKVAREMLDMLKRTPEQIEAMQAHSLDYFTLEMLGHHQPVAMSYQGVISYEVASPTQTISAQLPYGVDFAKGSATIDPSVALPVVALFAADKLTLPKDMKSHTVTFTLPEEVREKLPTDVIYTAFIDGVNLAFNELDSEYFTPVDISDDTYARKIGAKRAVKIYWGSKETGEFLGKVLKSMSKDLQAHVADNTELYAGEIGAETLQDILATWSVVERDFQSKDVGGLLQIVEAVAPINFQQSSYYYLANDDTLKGYQTKMSVGSELYGWMMDSVQQTRYDTASVQASSLYPLYMQDFGANAPEPVNGNEWFESKSDADMEREARYARYDYPDWETLEPGYEAPSDIGADDDDLQFDDEVSEEERTRRAFAVFESDEAEDSIQMSEYEDEKRPRNKQEMRKKWAK